MPALPNVAKVVRVDFFMTKGSDTRVRDRMFIQYSGAGPSVADMLTFLNQVSTAWASNISPMQDTATSLTSILGTDLTGPSSAQNLNAVTRLGSRAGSGLQAGVAAIVKFKVARRYRGGHPRLYLPCGVGTDTSTAQQWSGTFTAALLSAWQAFITALPTGLPASFGTISHVNVSYFQGFHLVTPLSGRTRAVPTIRSGAPVVDTVISYAINPNFGSQRRRNLQSA